jgi:hypothetical protein
MLSASASSYMFLQQGATLGDFDVYFRCQLPSHSSWEVKNFRSSPVKILDDTS